MSAVNGQVRQQSRYRFASLGSGSRGNATLVQSSDTALLIDCGFPAREMIQRCEQLDFDPAALDAILVTHEHGDHMRGVGPVARRLGLPVWMTHGTGRANGFGKLAQLRLFSSHDPAFTIGDIEVRPVAVPHDAHDPTQFVLTHAGLSLGLLTDLGCLTPHIIQAYAGVDALLLECNHDLKMLAGGPYPPRLQARVGGNYGHLNNLQAAELLRRIDLHRLRHLVAGHLSEKNNNPGLAMDCLLEVDDSVQHCLSLLRQDQVSDWFYISQPAG